MLPDTDTALDRLLASTWDCAARTALIEALRLLTVRQEREASNILMEHFGSIVARSRTFLEAEQAMAKAKGRA